MTARGLLFELACVGGVAFWLSGPSLAAAPAGEGGLPPAEMPTEMPTEMPAEMPAANAEPGVAPDEVQAEPPVTNAVPAIDPSDLIGAPAGPPLSGAALREQTHVVAKLLRCPVCQGLSVADSPSESALAMKDEVQDLVAQGYDAEQILLYFEASYGEFIRLEPKFEGVNVFVWGSPIALLIVGGAWIAWSIRRRGGPKDEPSRAKPGAPASAAAPDDPDLSDYLRRVREETR